MMSFYVVMFALPVVIIALVAALSYRIKADDHG